jgi:hypothetical protein
LLSPSLLVTGRADQTTYISGLRHLLAGRMPALQMLSLALDAAKGADQRHDPTAARTQRSAVGHGVGVGFLGLELGGKNMLCSPGLAFLLAQDGRLVEQSADAVAPDLGRRMQPAKE